MMGSVGASTTSLCHRFVEVSGLKELGRIFMKKDTKKMKKKYSHLGFSESEEEGTMILHLKESIFPICSI